MKCPYCNCVAHKHGKTDNEKQRYKCSNWWCGKTFTEVGKGKVFIINCPNCKKEIEGYKYGKVWYFKKQIRQPRYKCSMCGTVTVKLVRTEEKN